MAYSMEEARELVLKAGRELVASGLIARTWGNISCRLSADEFLITPSGRAYEQLTAEDLAVCRIADGSYDKNGPKPSSEKLVHAACYRLRPEAEFVIHTHQDYATAISTLGESLRMTALGPEAATRTGPAVPTAAYALSGTKKLAANVAACLERDPAVNAVLLRGHGAVFCGRCAEEAFRAAHLVEEAAAACYRELVGEEYQEDAAAPVPRLFRRGIHEEDYRWYRTFTKYGQASCVLEVKTPLLLKLSAYGRPVPVYVDDCAQMIGLRVPCLPETAGDREVAAALPGIPGAVFVRNRGAVLVAASADDAEALRMVLEKNCRAALLERAGNRPAKVGSLSGKLEHLVYTKQYAKQKDEGALC